MSADVPGPASERRWLIGLLIIYLLVGIPVAWRCVDQINPDGVAHLRLAEYYAEGNLHLAIVGLWSPLLSWLIAPLLRLGVDGQVAARGLLLLSGLGLTLASWLLFGRMGASGLYRRAATICIAVVSLSYSVFVLDPDLIAAALLAVYFWLSLDASVFEKPAAAFRMGLLIGIAYLTKAYALPFFVIHFLGIAVAYAVRKVPRARYRAARGFALAMAGALLIALPWAAVLSAKYGRLTFSTAGSMNHARVGPVVNWTHLHLRGLKWPKDGRLSEEEDLTDGSRYYPPWSPFEDWASFKHQLRIIGNNLRRVLQHRYVIYHLGALSSLLLYILLLRAGAPRKMPAVPWALWTVCVYASGYVMIDLEDRYLWPLVPVLVGLSFSLLQSVAEMGRREPAASSGQGRRIIAPLWAAGILAALLAALPLASLARRCLIPATAGIPLLAEDLRSLPVAPPIAANNWNVGLYAAHHLNMVYMGRPAHNAPEEIAAELCSARANTYLVFDDAKLAAQLGEQRDLKHLATLQLRGHPFGEVAVFDVQCGDVIRPERMGETWP